jgi:hypothetical protein
VATLILLVQAVQVSPRGIGAFIWVVAVLAICIAARAPFSARARIRDQTLLVRNLLWTTRIPLTDVEGFAMEIGNVNLYGRAYLRLTLASGASRRLTQFNRAERDAASVEDQATFMNEGIRANGLGRGK